MKWRFISSASALAATNLWSVITSLECCWASSCLMFRVFTSICASLSAAAFASRITSGPETLTCGGTHEPA